MKVLIVCSRRYYAPYTDYVAPFIYEQVEGLRRMGYQIDYFLITGGWKGFFKAIPALHKRLQTTAYNLIHIHYGLSGFPCLFEHRVPFVVTLHGSDINQKHIRRISQLVMRRAKQSIFVSQRLWQTAGSPQKSQVIPCGVDTSFFRPLNQAECRQKLGWESGKTYVLFSKEFADKAKNYPLAKAAMASFEGAELVELFGYTREQMVWLYNACDAALMTSWTEGSPQFVKEAVACGCPVVSTDVGDVKEVIEGVPNCFLTTYEPANVVSQLRNALQAGHLPAPALPARYEAQKVIQQIAQCYQHFAR